MSITIIGNVYWVKDSVTINTTFNATNNKYQLTVGHITEDDVERLAVEYGIKMKEDKEEQGPTLTAKSLYPFIFKDTEGNLIEPHFIRNGSKVEVKVTNSYPHAFSKKYGNGASVYKEVIVHSLVE
jgi:hypothetical protein